MITLNRPKALNSLNLDMVRLMTPKIRELTHSSATAAIILKGAGGKAFCAGGDIKTLYEGRGNKETQALQEAFFREEYTLDHLLALSNAHKPHVALWDGTVMGGGVGISINASFRIATEKSLFAMPETGIGLFPDVGGSYFLPRLPRHFGTFLALTGYRLKGSDLVHAGVATHYVPSEKLPALEDALSQLPLGGMAGGKEISKARQHAVSLAIHAFALEKHSMPAYTIGDEELAKIEKIFSPESTVEEIGRQVHETASSSSSSPAFKQVAKTFDRMSPTSMKLTLEQMKRGGKTELPGCYGMEMRMVMRCMREKSDFFEGVRALLVDKDNNPKWQPSSLDKVSKKDIDEFFAPLSKEGIKEWEAAKW